MAVQKRLDRLTQDEARTNAAQALRVVYGLVQNMRAVVEGKQAHSGINPHTTELIFPLDGEASITGIQEALGAFSCRERASSASDWAPEILHEMASEKNKSKRP